MVTLLLLIYNIKSKQLSSGSTIIKIYGESHKYIIVNVLLINYYFFFYDVIIKLNSLLQALIIIMKKNMIFYCYLFEIILKLINSTLSSTTKYIQYSIAIHFTK